ncbi:MAG: lysylphosphatidylglycerol synthase transmembrane domain-containing protein [Pseudomonadota bacterium]
MVKLKSLLLITICALAVYGFWLSVQDLEVLVAGLDALGVPVLMGLLGLSLVNYGVRYARWTWLLGLPASAACDSRNLYAYIAGFALVTTPVKAGELIRCRYYKALLHIDHDRIVATLLTERVLDILSGLLIASLALSVLASLQMAIWLSLGIVALVFLTTRYPWVCLGIARWLSDRSPFEGASRLYTFVESTFETLTAQLTASRLLPGTLMGVVSWSAEAIGFAWLVILLGSDASFLMLMGIFAISLIAGAVSFLPGGLGGAEAAMYLLLTGSGLDAGSATIAVVITRLCTLWFAVLLGVVSALTLERTLAVESEQQRVF